MDSNSADGINRRQLLGRGGLAAAGAVVAGPLMGTGLGSAAASTARDPFAVKRPKRDRVPPAARPGGSYDRYVAKLAAEDKFSGTILLSHRGRTVLSRSYGMADKEKGIPNDENTAVYLSSASQPFVAVAILQLAQQGRLLLSDTVGTHLNGFAKEIAAKVNIHQLLTTTSGLSVADPDVRRIFRSKDEVLRFYRRSSRQAKLVAVPGAAYQGHTAGGGADLAIAAQIVEALTGMTYWDYVQKHVFARAGMTGSGFFTRSQWLSDPHIAQSYMLQSSGTRVDAVRNLDVDSLSMEGPHENPGRNFIGYAPGGGFATARDLVRFAHALLDGTLLERPFADLLIGAKFPGPGPNTFEAYAMPVAIIDGPQWIFGRGGSTGGSTANWSVYPETGWVGVVLSNYDEVPFEIYLQETHAITGEPIEGQGGGG
jgi:CubicO group peptidase (beta-lactamase class C family)